LLASECDGYLPDISVISFRLRLPEEKIKKQISKLNHWLVGDDINMISDGYQSDIPERETEEETETETDYRAGFDIFYHAYPKKVAPKDAEKSYQRALRSADHETIMIGLEKYKQSVATTERRFIQAPAAWLNKGRWADDYGTHKQEKTGFARAGL
jgi:hypothetical protein